MAVISCRIKKAEMCDMGAFLNGSTYLLRNLGNRDSMRATRAVSFVTGGEDLVDSSREAQCLVPLFRMA